MDLLIENALREQMGAPEIAIELLNAGGIPAIGVVEGSRIQMRYTPGPDIQAAIGLDPDAFMEEIKAHSTYSIGNA